MFNQRVPPVFLPLYFPSRASSPLSLVSFSSLSRILPLFLKAFFSKAFVLHQISALGALENSPQKNPTKPTRTAALGKILTADNLRKQKIIIVDRCYLCKRDGESVDHLLLHCDVAYTLWNLVFSRVGMSWVMPSRVIDLFACWWKARRPMSAAIWKMVPICIFWCVWKERNLRCFEEMENSLEDIVASFLRMLYLWTVAFLSPLSRSFSDFLVRFSLPS